jgi:hypothetical protein
MPHRVVVAALLLGLPAMTAAQSSRQQEVPVPPAARAFVAPGTRPIAYEVADLNRDGKPDAILVLEPTPKEPKEGEDDPDDRPRSLLVLVGGADGSLRQVTRNDKVAFCAGCGGIMGDPFEGVTVGPGTFTVDNAGGSNWRWSRSYTFNYSRRDDTWQLVRVEEHDYHTSEAADAKPVVSTPPKHFGKIDIADFDPESWKGQGPR